MKEMGRRLRHKLCLTMRCEPIQKTPVSLRYEFCTVKQLTFPKRKGNGQITMGSSFYIFLLKMKEMPSGRHFSWRTGICHTFIYKGIHSYGSPSYPGFLYTYLNTGIAEGLKGPSFLCWLRQLRHSRINLESVSAPCPFEQCRRNGENMKSEKSQKRNFTFLTSDINYFPWNVWLQVRKKA